MPNISTQAEKTRSQGLLLVGHGTADSAGIAEFQSLAEQIAARWQLGQVAVGFLEFAEPTIAEGVNQIAQSGAESFLVMPLLLFEAGHARRDIPQAIARAVSGVPRWSQPTPDAGVDDNQTVPYVWNQASPLECHRAVVQLSERRYHEALEQANRSQISPSEPIRKPTTHLVLVGRGSRDAEASAKMREFSALRAATTPDVEITTCFYAMAEPSLETVLNDLADRLPTNLPTDRCHRIVVQPHLLFQGRLVDAIADRVNATAKRRGDIDWVITEHLGPDPLLADAVIEICQQANVQTESYPNNSITGCGLTR